MNWIHATLLASNGSMNTPNTKSFVLFMYRLECRSLGLTNGTPSHVLDPCHVGLPTLWSPSYSSLSWVAFVLLWTRYGGDGRYVGDRHQKKQIALVLVWYEHALCRGSIVQCIRIDSNRSQQANPCLLVRAARSVKQFGSLES